MPSQINPNQFEDGQPVSKSALRDTLSTVKGELEHGGFTKIAPGAPTRRVNDKLREVISPTDFGAVGDGVTDDADALHKAFQFAADTGTPFVGGVGKTYRIATNFTVNRTIGNSLNIDLRGCTLLFEPATITIGATPTSFLTTAFTANPKKGDPFVSLASVTGLAKGDMIRVLHPVTSLNNVNIQHYYIVNEINGNDVYIEGTVIADINDEQTAAAGATGSIVVDAFKLNAPITICNGTVKQVDSVGAVIGILILNSDHVLVENVAFEGNARRHLGVEYYNSAIVAKCKFRDFGFTARDSGYGNLPDSPSGASFGYGILAQRGWLAIVSECVAGRGWHMVDAARGAMHLVVRNCFFGRNSYGVSNHESAWSMDVSGCTFDGNVGVTGARGTYLKVVNCRFLNQTSHAVVYSSGLAEVIVRGCEFDYRNATAIDGASAIRRADSLPQNPATVSALYPRNFNVSENTFSGKCRILVGFAGNSSQGNLWIKNNKSCEEAAITDAQAHAVTFIKGNSFGRVEQSAIVLNINAGDPRIVIDSNSKTGGSKVGGGAILVISSTSGSPAIDVTNNLSDTTYLVRFMVAATLRYVIGNTNSSRLFLGPGTAINVINNNYKIELGVNMTITNETGNVILS